MQQSLKATYTTEQIAMAASLNLSGKPLRDMVSSLFQALEDPLLAKDEIKELLHLDSEPEALDEALAGLVTEEVLERSSKTTRPLDADGTILYRLKDIPSTKLRILATEAELNDQTKRYQFTCDGRLIRSFARIDRLDAIAGSGNQRSEI